MVPSPWLATVRRDTIARLQGQGRKGLLETAEASRLELWLLVETAPNPAQPNPTRADPTGKELRK